METPDGEIQRIANEIQRCTIEQQELTLQEQSVAEKSAQEHLLEMQVRRTENAKLCARFAVWAANHDIPTNSPSPFARGWLLGHGDGPPSYSGSHQGESWSGNSSYALLVRSPNSVRELVFNDAKRGGRKYHLFSRTAVLERYKLASVVQSIGEFSGKYGIPWSD